jgi:hypothetical protein
VSVPDGADPVLDDLRDQLAALEGTAVDDHVAVFEHLDATIARELAQLDEV